MKNQKVFYISLYIKKEKRKLNVNSQKAVHCPAEAAKLGVNY